MEFSIEGAHGHGARGFEFSGLHILVLKFHPPKSTSKMMELKNGKFLLPYNVKNVKKY